MGLVSVFKADELFNFGIDLGLRSRFIGFAAGAHDALGPFDDVREPTLYGCGVLFCQSSDVRSTGILKACQRKNLLHGHLLHELAFLISQAKPLVHQRRASPVGNNTRDDIDLFVRRKAAVQADQRSLLAPEQLTCLVIRPLHDGVQLPEIVHLRPCLFRHGVLQALSILLRTEIPIRAQPEGAVVGNGLLGQRILPAALHVVCHAHYKTLDAGHVFDAVVLGLAEPGEDAAQIVDIGHQGPILNRSKIIG